MRKGCGQRLHFIIYKLSGNLYLNVEINNANSQVDAFLLKFVNICTFIYFLIYFLINLCIIFNSNRTKDSKGVEKRTRAAQGKNQQSVAFFCLWFVFHSIFLCFFFCFISFLLGLSTLLGLSRFLLYDFSPCFFALFAWFPVRGPEQTTESPGRAR